MRYLKAFSVYGRIGLAVILVTIIVGGISVLFLGDAYSIPSGTSLEAQASAIFWGRTIGHRYTCADMSRRGYQPFGRLWFGPACRYRRRHFRDTRRLFRRLDGQADLWFMRYYGGNTPTSPYDRTRRFFWAERKEHHPGDRNTVLGRPGEDSAVKSAFAAQRKVHYGGKKLWRVFFSYSDKAFTARTAAYHYGQYVRIISRPL